MIKQRVAIIGGGIAGLSAAYFLHEKYDLTLFEKSGYAGGHAHTVEIDYDGTHLMVDTAFMIFDTKHYPLFTQLLARLGVEKTERSNTSWGATFDDGALEYSTTSPLSQWNNISSLRSWKLFFQFVRFVRGSVRKLERDPDSLKRTAFHVHLRNLGISADCIEYLIVPLIAMTWSVTTDDAMNFPAMTVLQFLRNHNLLTVSPFQHVSWNMIPGGSIEYVRALTSGFRERIRLNSPVASVNRESGGIAVRFPDGKEERFDKVVIATHADEALKLLQEPTEDERSFLGAFPYRPNKMILHRDASFMPRRRSCWASFMYNDNAGTSEDELPVTYWLNSLQNIDERYPLFTSFNTERVPKERRFLEFEFSHPAFAAGSYAAQELLYTLQGVGGIYYTGSYFGFGFHEDALRSSLEVARLLGAEMTLSSA